MKARNNLGQYISVWNRIKTGGVALGITGMSGSFWMVGQHPQPKLISPIPQQAQVIVLPPKPYDIRYTYDQAYDYVWMRESGRGTNNPVGSNAQLCYEKGQFNEIGASGTKHSLCFKDREEQKQFFLSWLKKNMNGDIVTTLCVWNIGKRVTCEYGETFLKEHSL
jgi:hypothetical protein